MLQEAIQLIQDTAVDAKDAAIVAIPGVDNAVLISQGGKSTERTIPPPRRKHESNDIESFVEVIRNCGDKPSVWHNHTQVVALLNDAERRDTVTLNLVESKLFKSLQFKDGQRSFSQRELINFLRISLAGCVPPDLVSTLRTLNFRSAAKTDSTVEHAKDSLGRSVEQAVTGASDLPEEFLATIPVYANVLPDHRAGILVAVDVDFENQKFVLSVVGDGIMDAITEAQGVLSTKLTDLFDDVDQSVYYGKP